VSVPLGKALVAQRAVREAVRTTAEQPLMGVPLEVNATVPVGTGATDGATVAVNVTDSPGVEGFLPATTVVVDAAWLTVMEVVRLDGASLAPSPLKHAIALLLPTPPSWMPSMADNEAVEWQLVVHPLAGFKAEVPKGVPLHAEPE
jgi:hypothetical protein